MAYCLSRSQAIGLGMGLVGLTTSCATHTVTAPSPSPPAPSPPAQSPAVQVQTPAADAPKQPVAKTPLPSASGSPASGAVADLNPALLKKIRKNLSEKVAIAKQDTGKTYLSSLLLSQQAEKLVQGKFTSDLKRLAADVPIETEEYRLEVRQADASKAIMVALAKQPGFASYTGAVHAVEGGIPVTSICKTNVPSQTPPAAPKFTYSTFMCPPGSSSTN
ncbi:type IV pilin-like G/H family protein [Altericista sp. CCNU0014]|uniref:type IV pilin-like G/H family protein n=1 Tax=Altericista sp. CCNU0014 TaxID=3082949 RepID=UPI00384C60C4